MTTNTDLNWIANYIWGIADDVLRDLYVREAAAELPEGDVPDDAEESSEEYIIEEEVAV